MAIAAKNIMNLGFKGKSYSALLDESRLTGAKKSLENNVFALFDKAEVDFINKYKAKFNVEPRIFTDSAYESFKVIVQSYLDSDCTSPKDIRNSINKIYQNNLNSKNLISIDSDGLRIKKILLKTVKEDIRFVKKLLGQDSNLRQID